jgi:hypothetical protein
MSNNEWYHKVIYGSFFHKRNCPLTTTTNVFVDLIYKGTKFIVVKEMRMLEWHQTDYLIINKGNATRINPFITIDRKALLCGTFQNFNGYCLRKDKWFLCLNHCKSLEVFSSLNLSHLILFQMIIFLEQSNWPEQGSIFFQCQKRSCLHLSIMSFEHWSE